MELKKLFPYSAKATDISNLIVAIVVYILVAIVVGIVFGLLGAVTPLIGKIFNLISWIVRLYCGLGSIVAILVFLKVI